VFVNPALTEPFGLTLIEAAASGLPIIATEDGGPRDIVGYCKNGRLIDPLDATRLGEILYEAITDHAQWRRWSKSGVQGAHRHFSWAGHVKKYLQEVDKVIKKSQRRRPAAAVKSKLPTADRLLVSDIDNTLIGDWEALQALLGKLRNANGEVGFGIATGRRHESVLKVLKEWKVPLPDVLVTAVGTEIYYRDSMEPDPGYQQHLDYRWEPQAIREAMENINGVRMQGAAEQRRYKISYFIDPAKAPSIAEITRHLRQKHLHANVVFSHGMYLDILPVRASKGSAIRYLADKWGIPFDSILVAGDSGNDAEMLSGNTLGVVVGNHSEELEALRDRERIYFADGHYAWGILEGIEHYDFFGSLRASHEQGDNNE
jgi:sucrose-phosphate synthase